jgi:hypothetical protein
METVVLLLNVAKPGVVGVYFNVAVPVAIWFEVVETVPDV